MNTYYITKANFLRLIQSIADNYDAPNDTYYKYSIDSFTSDESNLLIWVKYFLNDSVEVSRHLEGIIECESHNYLIPSSKPAYHEHDGCVLMRNSYLNFDLPSGIKGIAERIERCRLLYYQILDEIKYDIYPTRDEFRKAKAKLVKAIKNDEHFAQWNGNNGLSLATLTINSFPEINKANSGIAPMEFLEYEIDKVVNQFKSGFDLERQRKQLKNTGAIGMQARQYFRNNDYNTRLIELLIDFTIAKYNPDLSFEKEVLKGLGFKPCSSCQASESEIESIERPRSDAIQTYLDRFHSIYEIVTDYGTTLFSNRPDEALLTWEDFKQQPIGSISYCVHQVHQTLQTVIRTGEDKFVFAEIPKDKDGHDIYFREVTVVSCKRLDINGRIKSKGNLKLMLLPAHY